MLRLLLVTNFPAPYRIPLYDEVARQIGEGFEVVYTDLKVEGHPWKIPQLNHPHHFIKNNESLTLIAKKFRPDVVILGGVNKYTLKLFLHCKVHHVRVGIFTDMWNIPFSKLSKTSQLIRRYLYRHSDLFIVPGKKSKEHIIKLTSKNKSPQIFTLPILPAIKHFPFSVTSSVAKEYDLLFSGQIIERKLPFFFLEVAAKVNEQMKIKVLVLGDGPLKGVMEQRLIAKGVDFTFAGYVKQEHLQTYYAKSRVLLFPTVNDPWGIVANEAISAGVPVIISPNAGAADDLIHSGKNGFVLEQDSNLWAEKSLEILNGEHKFIFEPPPSVELITEVFLESINGMVGR